MVIKRSWPTFLRRSRHKKPAWIKRTAKLYHPIEPKLQNLIQWFTISSQNR